MARDGGWTLFEPGRTPLPDDDTIVAESRFDRERQEAPVAVSIDTGPVSIGGGQCFDRARTNADRFQALSVVPVLQPSAGCLDDRARQLGVADERRAAAGGGDFLRRAAHVAVQAVEAQVAGGVSDFVE